MTNSRRQYRQQYPHSSVSDEIAHKAFWDQVLKPHRAGTRALNEITEKINAAVAVLTQMSQADTPERLRALEELTQFLWRTGLVVQKHRTRVNEAMITIDVARGVARPRKKARLAR